MEDDESDDVGDHGGLVQGGSHAFAVYVLLAEGAAAAVAGVADCGGADEVVAGCSSDKFDMEPLFQLLLPSRYTSSSGGCEGLESVGGV